MRLSEPVTARDMLDSLVAGANIPSWLGRLQSRREAMIDPPTRRLDKRGSDFGAVAPAKLPVSSDPWRALNQALLAICRDGGVDRCLHDLRATRHLATKNVPALRALAQRTGWGEGALAVGCLRAYQPWAAKDTKRALTEVAAWGGDKKRDARRNAEALVGESQLALKDWVKQWNRTQPI
jgi:hypothetical protein